MNARRTIGIVVALVCACAGGPALAAAVGRAPGGRHAPRSLSRAAATGTGTSTTGTTTTGTTTTATGTTTTATGTTTTATGTTTTSTSTVPTTTAPRLVVCFKQTRAAIAHVLGVSVGAVRGTQRVGSNDMPQCNYLVQHAHGKIGPHRRVVVVVNVDNAPQAAWRLMRKQVEASQFWGPEPPGWKAPLGLYGLGPYASWYYNLDEMMINNINRRYILTVSIVWPRATAKEMIALARAAVLPYRRTRRFASY